MPVARAAQRPRLLAVGDAVAATGFARVLHNVLAPLQDCYEIHHLGVNYHGDPHDLGWKIYPAKLGGDLMGTGRLLPLVESLAPRLIFLLNDLWVLRDYWRQIAGAVRGTGVKTVMYCPIDAGPVEPELLAELEGVDRFVVYTQFARGEIDKALAVLRTERPDFAFPGVDVVPHGVDVERFPPHAGDVRDLGDLRSAGRRRAWSALFGDDAPNFRAPFIVLNANRNQPRKRIDITIKGFAQFAAGKPENVKLHLHMGIEDAGWNVVTLARRYGIADRLILTARDRGIPAVPDEQLRDIYTSACVGVNTAVGEGWGLVSFEHAATGAAQIVPRHSACAELWEDAALLLEPRMTVTMERILTEGGLVSPDDLAAALERLYTDRDLLREMSIAAHRRATQPALRWPAVARAWGELFLETLAWD
jgi:glycosyltransferase involved in cell wall biosynthesis